MTFTSPVTNPGPISLPKTDIRSIVKRVEDLERAIFYLQTNRTPAPLLLHELSNGSPMGQVQDGGGVAYSSDVGQYWPKPVFAELSFHYLGAVIASIVSPPQHVRYPSSVVAAAADVSSITGTVEFEVQVNGSGIGSVSFSGTSSGRVGFTPVVLVPYTDLVTVEVTDDGGATDLVVKVEMGVKVGLTTI